MQPYLAELPALRGRGRIALRGQFPALMKRIQLTLFAIALALAFSGCETIGKLHTVTTYETSPQTADAIIASAEKTAEIADLTFDEFLKQERKYSKEVKQYVPKVHDFADYLRKPVDYKGEKVPNGQMYLMKLRAATEAFRANRTSDGEASLRTAIASVKALLDQTKDNLSKIPSLKGP
jgi:hypothetical protein